MDARSGPIARAANVRFIALGGRGVDSEVFRLARGGDAIVRAYISAMESLIGVTNDEG